MNVAVAARWLGLEELAAVMVTKYRARHACRGNLCKDDKQCF
jgi:hypothetical protein